MENKEDLERLINEVLGNYSQGSVTLMTGTGGMINYDWAMIETVTDKVDGNYKDLAQKYHSLYHNTIIELENKKYKYNRLSELFRRLWKKK